MILYWITYALKKCDLLGLDDQKEILNTIIEEIGSKSNDEGPTEETILQETQEEIHYEATKGTPYDDVETSKYLQFQNEQDAEGHDLLSDLIGALMVQPHMNPPEPLLSILILRCPILVSSSPFFPHHPRA